MRSDLEPQNPQNLRVVGEIKLIGLNGHYSTSTCMSSWQTGFFGTGVFGREIPNFTQSEMLHVWIIYLHYVKNGHIQGEMAR